MSLQDDPRGSTPDYTPEGNALADLYFTCRHCHDQPDGVYDEFWRPFRRDHSFGSATCDTDLAA